MEIVRPNKDSGLGIYAKSVSVPDLKAAKPVADEMIAYFDENNGSFKGAWERGFALAHCQVANVEEPMQLFVVEKELVVPQGKGVEGKQNLTNTFFEAQAIFNCEVLDAPRKITRKVPKRKVTRDPKNKMQATVELEWEEKEVDNIIKVPEGCMSFNETFRKEKKVDRKYRITVRYQYLVKGLLGQRVETFEGEVEGLKAHIIQHETDHFKGKNIYYQS